MLKCDFVIVTNQAAYILRENTGTSGLVNSARDALAILAEHDIPHLIVGGLAVQEAVQEAVETMTGLQVREVEVLVQGVRARGR